jgi:hypothetical protein
MSSCVQHRPLELEEPIDEPRNGTVLIAFLICSLAIGGAVFLILEMDRPLDGVMQISSWPMQNALAHMSWQP